MKKSEDRDVRDPIMENPKRLPKSLKKFRNSIAFRGFKIPNRGSADILLINKKGNVAIVECKLLSSSECNMKVVWQLISYYVLLLAQGEKYILDSLCAPIKRHRKITEQEYYSRCLSKFLKRGESLLTKGKITLILAFDGNPFKSQFHHEDKMEKLKNAIAFANKIFLQPLGQGHIEVIEVKNREKIKACPYTIKSNPNFLILDSKSYKKNKEEKRIIVHYA